ncbi:MAG: hypothetical protein EXR62_07445 [Chloroflexi bacterium]|nr:hypothetical protein [Chloroflexota bacterium]
MPPPLIAMLTDFGTHNHYVAAMKGVILNIAPTSILVDITHDIPAQDVRTAAQILGHVYHYFPDYTVFLAVVDPRVGTDRHGIAVEAGRYILVGPDNGIFSRILEEQHVIQAINLTEKRYWRSEISQTFHGRDIFAPVAANLSIGVALQAMGHPLDNLVHLPRPRLERLPDGSIDGEIVLVDHFGNCITNIPGKWLQPEMKVLVGIIEIGTIAVNYAAAQPGTPIALVGSNNTLEIALSQGNASTIYNLKAGMPVHASKGS